MAMVLRLSLLTAFSAPAFSTECLMIGKVYEDVSKHKYENVKKWEDCAQLCNQTNNCSLFTYQPESVLKSACWLMKDSGSAVMVDDPYSISGSKACLATRPKSMRPCPEPGVFFEDDILPDPHLWTSTWQECQAKCTNHKSCNYFSWKQDTTPNGGCWMLPSHNFTKFHKDRYAISGEDQCPWIKLSDSDKLGAKIGDPGKVILDCRANRTLYKDLVLPSPKMYLEKWEDCQVACDDSDTCKAYSFKQDTNPPGGCWLFRNLKYGTKISDDNAITGRKWCKIPSPGSQLGAKAPALDHPLPVSPVSPTESPTSGPNYLWLMLCALALALLCCFGLLCLAFQKRKSPKTRAMNVEESETDEEVLLAAAPVPSPAPAPPAALLLPQVAPRPMPAAVTYYRVKPKSAEPELAEPSEPVASGV